MRKKTATDLENTSKSWTAVSKKVLTGLNEKMKDFTLKFTLHLPKSGLACGIDQCTLWTLTLENPTSFWVSFHFSSSFGHKVSFITAYPGPRYILMLQSL